MTTEPTTVNPTVVYVQSPGRSVVAVLSVPAVFLSSLLGLVLAVVARRRITRTGQKGANWAMTGIVLNGLVLAFDLLVLHSLPFAH